VPVKDVSGVERWRCWRISGIPGPPEKASGPNRSWPRARGKNTFRHGLSLPACSSPALSEEVEALAREIAGPDATAEIQDLARQIAEAQIDAWATNIMSLTQTRGWNSNS